MSVAQMSCFGGCLGGVKVVSLKYKHGHLKKNRAKYVYYINSMPVFPKQGRQSTQDVMTTFP